MARKYTQTKRIENSYRAYRRDWLSWQRKGYAMKTKAPMSKEDYTKLYNLGRLAGEKNIAANLAAEGRAITYTEAREFAKKFKAIDPTEKVIKDKIEKDFKSIADIKRNINKWTYKMGDETFSGRQAVYLEWAYLYGEEVADELFGY